MPEHSAATPPTLAELMRRQEPLLPPLARFYSERPFPVLKHPLVFSVPHAQPLNAVVNASFLAKRNAAAQAKASGEFLRYIMLHERPYRLNAFESIQSRLADAAYWRTLRRVYQDAENVEELPRRWRRALLAKRPQREAMMTPEERTFLEALPETLTVWRGASSPDELRAGFGWSLSERVARWFALRAPTGRPLLAKGEVMKAHVLAYLDGRNEDEIVVAFESVTALRVRRI